MFLVNKYTNELEYVMSLYSSDTKKEPAALTPKLASILASPSDSEMSIADILKVVNEVYPSILSEDCS